MDFKNRIITMTLVFVLLIFAQNAYAYLEPGSGSFVLQMLIAGVLGLLFILKNIWRNLTSLVRNLFTKAGGFVKKFSKKNT